MADSRKWNENHKDYYRGYDRENRVQIAIKLNKVTDADLIETYRSIPNKAQWFKACLREYAAKHPKQED